MTKPILLLALLSMAVGMLSLPATAAEPDAGAALKKLLDEAWEFDLREDPLFATHAGDRRYNDKLPRETPAAIASRTSQRRVFLDRLRTIAPERLSAADKINYAMFERLLKDSIAEVDFNAHFMPITNRSGFHISFPDLPQSVPLETTEDYQNYIRRLKAFRQYADGHIELMREGIKQGMVLPDVSLAGFRTSLEAHIVEDPERSVLYAPFKTFSKHVAPELHETLRKEARAAISQSVVPGYAEFYRFMEGEYVPAARASIGASALPKGREFYRHRVKKFTTLDITPDRVHEIGLAAVKRIKEEMEAVIREVGFKGDFAAFVEHLRSEPKFYAETPQQLLERVSFVLKKMDGRLPALFGKLPRTPYGIREVPEFIAPATTTAYYMQPAGDGTRAGFYYVNTYNLKSRPLYEVEALSLHEAVPGHHLQLALQQEMTDLPKFRRFDGCTAFVEGWGLYAERLGLETGFYEDPYSNFGRLSYEAWRACRLVVDTGIHHLGWTRQQAIDFMAEKTALTMHNIRAEVDRYISWPGQALAYKMGELKIRELRQRAEQSSGDQFNVREFHDLILSQGSVPLDVLEEIVMSHYDRDDKLDAPRDIRQ